ncbi:hypothetical protein GWI33_006190 [Rhynchophorus ferrugineus]|uniref:C-CAP/cofactor C-like domain-containing protein n=1 Tax=Rhynchophorus ferrugineus TaxID=354439 RepID=A0A834IKS5_RHYFE|nr:hypothetical protein GWI33_006190 [Rhynchophorus ferrugineus]
MSANTKNSPNYIYAEAFQNYLKHSEIIGGTIYEQSVAVDNAFKIMLDLFHGFNKYKKPASPLSEQYLTDPLFQEIEKIKTFEAKASDYIFQITLICKSIKIFEWVREIDIEKFIAKLNKYVQFYQQKAQSEADSLGLIHLEWLKSWNQVYDDFSTYIKTNCKNGIVWYGSASIPVHSVLGDVPAMQKTHQHQVLLEDINRGETIQNILHAFATGPDTTSKVFEKKDEKWLIQNQKGNHKDLVLNTARKDECISISNCEDCTIVIENIINSIKVELCKKVTVLLRHTSTAQIQDCKDCNIHCFDKIISVEMTSCENCGLYLSDKSLDTNISTTKCIGTGVSFPFDDGPYKTFKISDTIRTKIIPNNGIDMKPC